MSVKIEVWGEYGLFTRPEMKVERVTFDMITPSAAEVYWKVFLAPRTFVENR